MPFIVKRILAMLALLGGQLAMAGIDWENSSQDFQKCPEDKELVVGFDFKNTGTGPVTINSISSSCGCTTAELTKKTYLAGEGGKLVAKFTFGGRTGAQSKTITVVTDDKKSTRLAFNCLITGEPVTLTPSFAFWRVGDAVEDKRIDVILTKKPAVRIVTVASSNPRIVADLKETGDGGPPTILIHPVDTTRAESGEIFVQTDYPPEGPKAYTIQVRVK